MMSNSLDNYNVIELDMNEFLDTDAVELEYVVNEDGILDSNGPPKLQKLIADSFNNNLNTSTAQNCEYVSITEDDLNLNVPFEDVINLDSDYVPDSNYNNADEAPKSK